MKWARRHPSGALFAAQLLQVVLEPFLDTSRAGEAGLGVVGTVVVCVALWAVRHTPALSVFAFTLGLPAKHRQVQHGCTERNVLQAPRAISADVGSTRRPEADKAGEPRAHRPRRCHHRDPRPRKPTERPQPPPAPLIAAHHGDPRHATRRKPPAEPGNWT